MEVTCVWAACVLLCYLSFDKITCSVWHVLWHYKGSGEGGGRERGRGGGEYICACEWFTLKVVPIWTNLM